MKREQFGSASVLSWYLQDVSWALERLERFPTWLENIRWSGLYPGIPALSCPSWDFPSLYEFSVGRASQKSIAHPNNVLEPPPHQVALRQMAAYCRIIFWSCFILW